MKKVIYVVILLITFFLYVTNTYAITDIKVNNQYLSPYFEKDIQIYNYFATTNQINVTCKLEENETIKGDGVYVLENNETEVLIESSLGKTYKINVYKENNNKEIVFPLLKSLVIKNYDITFDPNTFIYDVYIEQEDKLDISYELQNSNLKAIFEGNDNLNKSKNVITIKVFDEKDNSNTYTINVYKTVTTFNENKVVETKVINKTVVTIIICLLDLLLISFMIYFFYFKKFKYHF